MKLQIAWNLMNFRVEIQDKELELRPSQKRKRIRVARVSASSSRYAEIS